MPRDLAAVLASAPSRQRGPVARGILASGSAPKVDRNGGRDGVGLIRQVAVITRCEAEGHGFWIDPTFLATVRGAINASSNGIKSRFTHPSLSGDGLGTFLGRLTNATQTGDVVRADLHLAAAATSAPDGNLAAYVLGLAESDPDAFGLSIVFAHDEEAEDAVLQAYGGNAGFSSPDPRNVQNLPHARMARLLAADVVDTPAANPNGLFHRSDIPQDADALLEYALGRGPKPCESSFAIDPERLRGYLDRALSARGLEIRTKETRTVSQKPASPPDESLATVAIAVAVSDDEECPTDSAAPVADPAASPAAAAPPTATVVEMSAASGNAPEIPENSQAANSSETPKSSTGGTPRTGKDFLSRFGDQGGVWFAQGKTWEDCERLHVDQLNATISAQAEEIKQLKAQAANRRGATSPLSASIASNDEPEAPGTTPGTPLSGTAMFAATLKLPTRVNTR